MSGKSPSLSLLLFLILLLLYKTLPPSLSDGRGGGGVWLRQRTETKETKEELPSTPAPGEVGKKKGMLKAQGDASRGIEDSGGGSACQDVRFFIPHSSSSSPHLFLACLEVRDSACLSSGTLFSLLLLTSKYFASTYFPTSVNNDFQALHPNLMTELS